MPRTGERGGPQTRARIAEVATRLFLDRGFDAVTVAEVAREAGVSSVTVFNHFPRKEDLLLDRAVDAVELLRWAVRDRDPGVDVLASLRDVTLGLLDPATRCPASTTGPFPSSGPSRRRPRWSPAPGRSPPTCSGPSPRSSTATRPSRATRRCWPRSSSPVTAPCWWRPRAASSPGSRRRRGGRPPRALRAAVRRPPQRRHPPAVRPLHPEPGAGYPRLDCGCAGKSGRRYSSSIPLEDARMHASPPRPRLFGRGSWPEARRIGDLLRTETTGGLLLVAAAALALLWANSPWRAAYADLSGLRVGPAALHLDLTLADLGGRRAAGDLLLRRRAGAQARVRRRRPARPAPGRAAGGRRGRRDGRARADLRRGQPRGRRAGAARLGDPDRHRHRLRAGGAGGDQHPPAVRAADVPADPRRGRRPAGDHHHRDLLHRRARTWCRCCWPLRAAGAVRACWCSAGSGPGGCCCRWPRRPGCWCTSPACTPPSPGCCSASPCRWSARAEGPGPGLAEHFEHRLRPLSAGVAVPVFAFFAAGVSIVGAAASARRSRDPVDARHRRRAGGGQDRRRARRDLAGAAVHPRPARRGPELVGRARAGAARRASASPSRC